MCTFLKCLKYLLNRKLYWPIQDRIFTNFATTEFGDSTLKDKRILCRKSGSQSTYSNKNKGCLNSNRIQNFVCNFSTNV